MSYAIPDEDSYPSKRDFITDVAISVSVALLVCTLWKVWTPLSHGSENLYWWMAAIVFAVALMYQREANWKLGRL